MKTYNDLVSLEEAIRLVFEHRVPVRTERLPLENCLGRLLTEDIRALVTLPPFDASAMDGYAVRFEDVRAIGSKITLLGEVAAGQTNPFSIEQKQAVRVFTGAPLPEGADHILLQEHAVEKNGEISVNKVQEKPRHIRSAGGDFCRGDLVLLEGTTLTPSHIGLAAAANHSHLEVRQKPNIAILTSGSELMPPGSELSQGQIIESNSYTLSALLNAHGVTTSKLDLARDDQASIESRFAAASEADMVLAIGGASVGKHDRVRAAFRNVGGEFLFERIAVRPGKPTWFGVIGAKPVLGVPGNPTAAFVIASLLIRPLFGLFPTIAYTDAILKGSLDPNGSRETFTRAHCTHENGVLCVAPLHDQDTSRVNMLTSTNCLIHRGSDDPEKARGEAVQIVELA